MKIYIRLLVVLTILFLLNEGRALAHSGNTDSNGGHYCHTCNDGSYHYHNRGKVSRSSSVNQVIYNSALRNDNYYTNPSKKANYSKLLTFPYGITHTTYLIFLCLLALIILLPILKSLKRNEWVIKHIHERNKYFSLLVIAFILITVHIITLPKLTPSDIRKEFLTASTDTYFALQGLEVPNSPNPIETMFRNGVFEDFKPKQAVVKSYLYEYQGSTLSNREQEIFRHLNHMIRAMNIRLQDNNDMTYYEKYFIHKKQVVGLLGLTFTAGNVESEEMVFEDEYDDYSVLSTTVEEDSGIAHTMEDSGEEIDEPASSDGEDIDIDEDLDVDTQSDESESTINESEVEIDSQELNTTVNQGNVFTLGSTQEEVKKAMGTPDSISQYTSLGDIWKYGWSTITFDSEGKVKEWNNSDNNLTVWLGDKLEAASPFTLGSTKEQVLQAMGTPDTIEQYEALGDVWKYGYSKIEFSTDELVDGWRDSDSNLNVTMNKLSETSFFTIGSTKQDVVDAMGTPDSVEHYEALGDRWGYGYSTVEFDTDGLVDGWRDSSGNLKVQ